MCLWVCLWVCSLYCTCTVCVNVSVCLYTLYESVLGLGEMFEYWNLRLFAVLLKQSIWIRMLFSNLRTTPCLHVPDTKTHKLCVHVHVHVYMYPQPTQFVWNLSEDVEVANRITCSGCGWCMYMSWFHTGCFVREGEELIMWGTMLL